ncbi:segregation/condensation protein A [candidate division NPL-UPA2 bacterium]|nr:segregation/condensation protein A [candidate division NPL-UPA2 bacterium]
MSYKVQLEIFEGPLDLLLYLIKREELDIYHIPIARIAEQYLDYIRMMRMLNLDVAGEFLVMAATLMHIKSRMLLPQEELREEEEDEDPQAELIKQLIEYQKFKGMAEKLEERQIMQEEIFSRGRDETMGLAQKEGFLLEANLFDLLTAFSRVLTTVSEEGFTEVVEDEATVNEKIREILDVLRVKASLNFTKLFAGLATKVEMVVAFLALLELIRLKEVKIRQAQRFGEIRVYKNSNP